MHTAIRYISFILLYFTVFVKLYAQENSVSGFVFTQDSTPITNAYIIINKGSLTLQSDSTGTFNFTNKFGMHIEIDAYKNGYTTYSARLPSDSLYILLTPIEENLEMIVKTKSRTDIYSKKTNLPIAYIDKLFIKQSQGGTLMQILSAVPGIQSIDVGSGISKPMIRGMGFYRIVMAENGIKKEGQQWSNHHGTHIDPNAIEHIEIIKGPQSLLYGSDAIGGVINILPHHIPLQEGYSSENTSILKSNPIWFGASHSSVYRKNTEYINVILSYNKYSDFKSSTKDDYIIPRPVHATEASHAIARSKYISNTAGENKSVSITLGSLRNSYHGYIEGSFYNSSSGFFDWEGLMHDSIRSYHAQSIFDIHLPYLVENNTAIHHFNTWYKNNFTIELAYGYQMNASKEYAALTDKTGTRTADYNKYAALGNLDVALNLATIDAHTIVSKKISSRNSIKIGTQIQSQHQKIDGYNHILPAYRKTTGGIFSIYEHTVKSYLTLQAGLRIDAAHLQIQETAHPDKFLNHIILNPAIDTIYIGNAISCGLLYSKHTKFRYKANIGKSFRVPSVYELAAYGLHKHEGRFEEGNSTNQAESAWQLDMEFLYKYSKTASINCSPFFTYFNNYLYAAPTPKLQPEGQIYEYQQTKAALYGGELQASYAINTRIALHSSVEYVYSIQLPTRSALPYTPPAKLTNQIDYTIQRPRFHIKFTGEHIFTATQTHTVPNELRTPYSNIFSIKGTYSILRTKTNAYILLYIHNILNTPYYNHISFYRRLRIPEQGRSIQLQINIPINRVKKLFN